MISASTYLWVELAGAAVLAFWTVLRAPRLGPRSLRTSAGLGLAVLLLMRAVPPAVPALLRLPGGVYVVLLVAGIVAYAAFLTAAWFLRLLAGALGGSGGGPGIRIPTR